MRWKPGLDEMKARRQQQQRRGSLTEVQQQMQATPRHRQIVHGSALLSKAEQEHGKRQGVAPHWTYWDFSMCKFYALSAMHKI